MHVHAWMRQISFTRRVDTANRTSSKLSQFFNSMVYVNLHVSSIICLYKYYRQGFGYASRAIATPGYLEKDPAAAVVREHVQTCGEKTVSSHTAWLPDSGSLRARGTMRWMERLCTSADFSFCTSETRKDQMQAVRLRRAAKRAARPIK